MPLPSDSNLATEYLANPTAAKFEELREALGDSALVIDVLYSAACRENVPPAILQRFVGLLLDHGKIIEAGEFLRRLQLKGIPNPTESLLQAAIGSAKADFQMTLDAYQKAEKQGASAQTLMATGMLMLISGGHWVAATQYAHEKFDETRGDWLCWDIAVDLALQTNDCDLLIQAVVNSGQEPSLGTRNKQRAMTMLRTRLQERLRDRMHGMSK